MIDALILLTTALGQTASETISTTATQAGAVKFTGMLLRYESVMITSAAYALLQAFKKMMPDISEHPHIARFRPLYPIILCSVMAFLPSFQLPGSLWDECLLYGICLGTGTGQAFKALKSIGFGGNVSPEDPQLQSMIDEYQAAKADGKVTEAERKSMSDHIAKWLL